MKLFEEFYILNYFQILIITLILVFYKSTKPQQNKYLALHFLTLLIEAFTLLIKDRINHPAVFFHPFQLNFLSCVFMYFYATETSNIKVKHKIKFYILALIEFIIFSVIFIKLLYDPDYGNTLLKSSSLKFYRVLFFGFIIFMCIKTIKVVNQHKTLIQYSFSETKHKNLTWLSVFCFVIIFSSLLGVLSNLMLPENQIIKSLFKATYQLNLYYLSIACLIQINILNVSISPYEKSLIEKKRTEKEKNKSTLIHAFNKIETTLVQDEMYMNPILDLGLFAKKIKISKRNISRAINEVGHKNFNDYINFYRIEAFKIAITRKENQKYSIEAIAKDVGFNSKASFYKNFKKATGICPTKYVKEKIL